MSMMKVLRTLFTRRDDETQAILSADAEHRRGLEKARDRLVSGLNDLMDFPAVKPPPRPQPIRHVRH